MARLVKAAHNKARSIPGRFRYLFLFATVSGGCFLILTITNGTDILLLKDGQNSLSMEDVIAQLDSSFTIKTDGCTIPGLQPLDESVKKFKETPTPAQCPNANYSLIEHNTTHLWVDIELLEYYNVPKDDNVSCCYQSFYRPSAVNDIFSKKVDDRVEYEACENFSNHKEIMHEFVTITCEYQNKLIYEQYFLFAKQKPMYNEPSSYNSQNQGIYYNVIVMGIDAVSRLNFHRTMTKTLTFLKSKGAIELLGYNKVADNTFPNLMPMLVGFEEKELKTTCWPRDDANFDNCPFLWHRYKDAGFYTALGEDSASLGTFNYAKFGFIKTPTDYYIHPLIYEAEKTIGNTKDFNSYICMGNKYFFEVLLEYIGNLASTLRHSKLFGFFWEVTMSHDYLNYPMAMDESYEKLLRKLDDIGYLNKTVLILLSDHGIRWGDIRYTKQGRFEERLPLVNLLLPPSFEENYKSAYDIIKRNSRRLTTPFDIYATLSDLINLDSITDAKIMKRLHRNYANDRSISLFLPIPTNRTCATAGISDHWCTCNRGAKLPIRSAEARKLATQLINQLNLLLTDYSQCAKLHLADVIEVTELLPSMTQEEDEVGWREFLVVVRALPGGGVFEGTLRQAKTDHWSLDGSVSRLNLYGDQSRCIPHYQLKLYCFCL